MTTVYYLKKKPSSLSIWTKMEVISHHVFYTYVNRQPFSLKFGQYNGRRTCTVGKKVKKLILDGQTEIMQTLATKAQKKDTSTIHCTIQAKNDQTKYLLP